MVVQRLAVDGRDYFLPSSVDALKASILDAMKAGGGYVNIPGPRGGPGLDILFSPGMPVVWAQIEVDDTPQEPEASRMASDYDDFA